MQSKSIIAKLRAWLGLSSDDDQKLNLWILMYLGFLFINWNQAPWRQWLVPTLISIALFLPLYFHARRASRRATLAHAAAIALLGFALTPLNTGANTYLIYAGVLLPFTGIPLRTSIAIIAAGLAVYAIELALLAWPYEFLAISVAMTAIVSMSVCAANHFQREKRLRQAELKLSHDEVRRLAATAERERIGRDLHDLLGHTLSLVAVKSELAGRLLDLERDPAAARREIAEVERVARDALSQVRSAVTGIRAAALVSELASSRLLLESAGVHFDYRGDWAGLPTDVETCMALIVREAVTNVQRHARASRAEVSVERERDRAILRVRDDGRGGIGAHGNGLTGMRERIEALGGSFSIRSERGHGTELNIALPLPVAELPALKSAQPASALTVSATLKHA